MPVPLLGIALTQLGIRAIPVLLRTGQMAIRYLITSPGNKGKVLKSVAQNTVGRNSVVDDVGSLTAKVKDNPVSKILDVKTLSSAERNALMQTTYKDATKILKGQKSYPVNAKFAKDIERGFNQKFDPRFAKDSFVTGDKAVIQAEVAKKTLETKAKVAGQQFAKQTAEKAATAPKGLPAPTVAETAASIKTAKDVAQTKAALEAGKAATGVAKARITAGMGVTREGLKQVPKEARKQIISLQRGTKKLSEAAKGAPANVIARRETGINKAMEVARKEGNFSEVLKLQDELAALRTGDRVTGKVITEGLRGVRKNPKPAWWQGAIPSWLRVGGQPYKGAYPGAVSGERIAGTTVGVGVGTGAIYSLGKGIHEAILEAELAAEGPTELTTAEILAQQAEEYKNSYNPNATIDSSNVILPKTIE